LPGWGGWAGAGIDPNALQTKKKPKKRNGRKILVINPSDVIRTDEDREQLIRKDSGLKNVIISEKKDIKIAEYQVNEGFDTDVKKFGGLEI
jgi:U3 small nucleolar RNA-associated protein 14